MAAALVGGAFLSATLQVLFDRLASRPVLDFFRGRKFSDSPLKKLEIKLMAIDAVLNDAEDKEITNPSVKKWVDELKDAVYDAEDIVDEIATKALQFKLEVEARAGTDQVRNVSSTSCSIDAQMETKIEEILARLEYITQQKDVLGLKQVAGWKPSRRLPSTSLVEESGVFGRDRDKEKIFGMLELDNASADELNVITIVGMGGVGKTTLAQLVYNDSKLKDKFDLKAWVCISEDFDVVRVTKTILEGVNFSACDINDLNLLQLKLKENLTGKKLLLVLDDVWNENYNDWEVLQRPFRYGAAGSKIIVTTRSENVAQMMGRSKAHYLDKLSDEDCWMIFSKYTFDNKNSSKTQELQVIGKRIVAKCKGLPLAAKTLGGLLRSKDDVADWDKILNSELWKLQSDIIPALRLSYHYLPSHLKRCFAYSSIFPKDCGFRKQQVILLWMAQDLLHDEHCSEQMEQVGSEYFNDLTSRSLFQRSSRDKTRFIMHDLVNDLANVVSGEFSFRLEDDNLCRIPEKTRHFSYLRKTYDAYRKFEVLKGAKRLRSFLPLSRHLSTAQITEKVSNDLLPAISCLRALSLSCYRNINELPESIGNLRHLRYMDLSSTAIKKLPDSTGNLSNLQTLLLSNCSSLVALATSIGGLTNLRHLDIRGTSLKDMPMHMSRLTNLQSLSTFIVGKHEGSKIVELREHKNLQGTLDILNLENVTTPTDALEVNLQDKTKLNELSLKWSDSSQEDSVRARDVLAKLQPQKKLKKLTIDHYGGTSFPVWFGDHSFSNMAFLCLSNCKYCVSLPSLGQLPSLRELRIISFHLVTEIGLEFHGQRSIAGKSFESLEILKFENMSEWEQWICSGNEGCSFPSLRKLYIKNCPKLKGALPDHLPNLTELVISKCQQLAASLPRASSYMSKVDLDGCDKLELSTYNNNIELLPSMNVQGLPMQILVQSSYWSSLQCLEFSNMPDLKEVPAWLLQSTAIEELRISNCPSLKSFPMHCLPTTLEELKIRDCGEINLLLPEPDDDIEIGNYSSLNMKTLDLSRSCDSLMSFPLGLFPQLKSLEMWDCVNLSILFIPKEVRNNLKSLTSLDLYHCHKLVNFPQGGLPIPNLTSLQISNCKRLKSLPEQMHNLLPSLQYFHIENCPEVELFQEEGLPCNLLSLIISNCNKLTARLRDWGLQSLQKLQDFRIGERKEVWESFPEEWLLPSSLTSLGLFPLPNVKNLNKRGLQHLSSLQTLKIYGCSNLQCIPKDCLPKSLSMLKISYCRLLQQRCQRDIGEDWPNISHVPTIVMEGKLIS